MLCFTLVDAYFRTIIKYFCTIVGKGSEKNFLFYVRHDSFEDELCIGISLCPHPIDCNSEPRRIGVAPPLLPLQVFFADIPELNLLLFNLCRITQPFISGWYTHK